jgi:hypothetical protein
LNSWRIVERGLPVEPWLNSGRVVLTLAELWLNSLWLNSS